MSEKVKALDFLTNYQKDEKHMNCELKYPRDDSNADTEFWTLLGGKPA